MHTLAATQCLITYLAISLYGHYGSNVHVNIAIPWYWHDYLYVRMAFPQQLHHVELITYAIRVCEKSDTRNEVEAS
jgi:hypothetical protein